METVSPDSIRNLLSVAAVGVSLLALVNSYRSSRETAMRARVATAVAGFNAKLAFQKNLMDWAGQVQDALGEIHEVLASDCSNERATERAQVALGRLTSLIDRGRWLLPNTDHKEYGLDKEAAYTGIRQPALDFVHFAYRLISAFIENPERRKTVVTELWPTRRQFTSFIQEKIDPRVREKELSELEASLRK